MLHLMRSQPPHDCGRLPFLEVSQLRTITPEGGEIEVVVPGNGRIRRGSPSPRTRGAVRSRRAGRWNASPSRPLPPNVRERPPVSGPPSDGGCVSSATTSSSRLEGIQVERLVCSVQSRVVGRSFCGWPWQLNGAAMSPAQAGDQNAKGREQADCGQSPRGRKPDMTDRLGVREASRFSEQKCHGIGGAPGPAVQSTRSSRRRAIWASVVRSGVRTTRDHCRPGVGRAGFLQSRSRDKPSQSWASG